ncbi:MAG: hypothetical protein GXO89_06610 [Chlorobi bacterium]|nr:hypothetical protein [Chlorobiota bacterium]
MKKKTIFGIIVAASLMMAAVSFNACTKQDELGQKQKKPAPENDHSIYNKISGFTQTMAQYKENPAYKSGESIPVDEAMWLMEGGMNLTYGFPAEEYGEFNTGTATLTLQKNVDGEIDMDEVAIKYQELIEAAREDYYNSGFEEKGLYLVDLEKTSETVTGTTFKVETITGNKGVDPYPFEYGDNWWYGEFGGGCAGNTQSGYDAAHELADMYPTYSLGQCMAIAGPISVEANGGDNWLRRPGDTEDNLNDYYIFCVKDNVQPFDYETDLCLMANEMSTYYGFLDYVVTNLAVEHGNVPPGHFFIKFTHNQGNQTSIFGGTLYRHEFVLKYGVPYVKPNCDTQIEL